VKIEQISTKVTINHL